MSLGVSLTRSGHVVLNESNPFHALFKSKASANIGLANSYHKPSSSDVSQATLDTQAREAIRDLFPRIPDKDLHQIISRAFQKVGIKVMVP